MGSNNLPIITNYFMKPIGGFEYLQNPKTRRFIIQKNSKNLEPMAKVFFSFLYISKTQNHFFLNFEKFKEPKLKFRKSKVCAMLKYLVHVLNSNICRC